MKLLAVKPSTRQGKKYVAELQDNAGKKHAVHFGAQGYEDYTVHKDAARKAKYIARHAAREKWGRDGILTAGFWSRHLLWNQPTLRASIADVKRSFNI